MTQSYRRSAHTFALAAIIFALVWALLPAASPATGQETSEQSDARQASPADLRQETAQTVPVVGVNEFIPGESESGLWIVELVGDALPSHAADNPGLFPSQADNGRLDAQSEPARAYREQLRDAQAQVLQQAAQEIGRAPEVVFTYTAALNGFAIRVDQNEAREIAKLDSVKRVQPDFVRELQTDAGPEFINAVQYDTSSDTPIVQPTIGTLGEGTVAGIIDSGISYENPSFAATVPIEDGGDGYTHTWEEDYFGVCSPDADAEDNLNPPDDICNDKLIGAWNFVPDAEYGARDDDGHGSHTASTTAGNQVLATVSSGEVTRDVTISGVAPRAHIISYNVCGAAFGGGCGSSAITAAIDQAITDGVVDSINYSIGSSSPGSPWNDPDALGFLNARAAGIFVATSAGNDGPGRSTVGSPSGTPWVTTVAASQHNRSYLQDIIVEGGNTYTGKGFTPALETPAEVVYAGNDDLNNPLCLADGFPDDTDFSGQIVICDRGESGRVEKSEIVADLGAVGYVLVNDPGNAASLNSDAFAVPGVHLSNSDGEALQAAVAAGPVTATITETQRVVNDDFADLQASFSSRGENRSVDYLSPDVTAPGVDIIAAKGVATPDNDGSPVEWGFLSGTSMSSPHTAGAGTLLGAAHAEWSPAEVQSALMLTARYEGLVKEDAQTPADPYDYGAGYIDVALADATGLIMDETEEDYLAANPDEDGDPTAVNHASLSNQDCLDSCAWTRTFTPVADASYTITTESDDGLTLTVDQGSVAATVGTDFNLSVTADVGTSPFGEPLFGRVILTPDDPSVSTAHLTVAVIPSAGVVPEEIVIDTRRDAGSVTEEGLRTLAADPLGIQVTGLNGGTEEDFALPVDPTNGDPFDGPEGTVFTTVEVTAETTRLIAEITASESPDLDLFVGAGDTPSGDTLLCVSASGTALEFCELNDPEPGTYWILIQNWDDSSDGAVDAFTLSTALVGGDQGNMTVIPSDPSPALNTPYDLTVAYDLEMEPGRSYFGSIILSSGDTQIGEIPVTVNRFADDVVKTANRERIRPNQTVSYQIEVKGNVGDSDIVYRITDEIPEELTLVPGSVLVDGEPSEEVTVDGDTIIWTPTQPTLEGADGDYVITTSATDEVCAGKAPVPLPDSFLQAGLEGDEIAFSAFPGLDTPFYEEVGSPIIFTDNGHMQVGPVDPIFVYDSMALPDPLITDGLLAMLLQDMEIVFDPGTSRGVKLASFTDGSAWLAEFAGLQLVSEPEERYSFELIGATSVVDAPGEFEYELHFFSVDDVSGPLTIGTQNQDATTANTLVNNSSAEGVIEDGTAVCFDYVGATADPIVLTFDATLNPGARGAITNTAASINTADPYSKIETTSVDVFGPGTGSGTPPPPPGGGTPPPPPGGGTPPPDDGTPGDPDTGPDLTPGTVTRLEGATRIETAVAISQDLFPEDDSADAVMLARADIPFDALSGTPLAKTQNGPVLLTTSEDLHPAALAEIDRVLADGGEIVLLGGTAALSQEVEDALAANYAVTRLAGPSRVETALDVAEFIGDPEAIMVATSENFPDALASGAAAAKEAGVVLLTQEADVHPAVQAYLDDHSETQTYAIGGPAAGAFSDATPLVGTGREDTSVLVAETFFDDPDMIGLARGDEFADALTGGAHAALTGGPVLLTPPDLLHPTVQDYTCAEAQVAGFIFGGSEAISDAVADAFLGAVTGEACPA